MKEEKKERIKQLIKKLSELSEEQRQSIVAKLGIRNPEGHLLSDRNQSLLYLQAMGSPLSVVAGYKQWQKSGRQVTKGQLGYIIAVPSAVQKSNSVLPINGNESTTVDAADDDIFFLWKAVFDISQTEEITEQSKGKAA
ncbi:MAG: hypothetical protein KGZ85_17240 [Ignavibacterium sp.]|nr:hypothetical protein [Ignavibacterium sp.]